MKIYLERVAPVPPPPSDVMVIRLSMEEFRNLRYALMRLTETDPYHVCSDKTVMAIIEQGRGY
jgi:hypothetical protein